MEAIWGLEGSWNRHLGCGLASSGAWRAVLEANWGLEGSWNRHLGYGFWQFRQQSGSVRAAEGGNLGQQRQPEGRFGFKGSSGEGIFGVFYRKY